MSTYTLDAASLGLRPASAEDLRGGDAQCNAAMLRRLLAGEDRSPRRDVVLLNSAAALAMDSGDFPTALAEAEKSLTSGAALTRLEGMIAFTRALAEIPAGS